MVDELALKLPDFSTVNHTRCFLHITNLVGKSLVKQFDVPKKKANAAIDAADQELQEMVQDLEEEAAIASAGAQDVEGGDDEAADDDVDGWVDEVTLLSDKECADLQNSIRPVKLVLAKVNVF